jgi:hypothetical protein
MGEAKRRKGKMDNYSDFTVRIIIPLPENEVQKQSHEVQQLHAILMGHLNEGQLTPCVCCKGHMLDSEGLFDGGMAFVFRKDESTDQSRRVLGAFVCFDCLDSPDVEQRIAKALPGHNEIVHDA